VDQHKETLLALKAGDPQAASDAILQDVLQGMEQIRLGIA
jgi:DNA-binding GntR family transcriptional regulator